MNYTISDPRGWTKFGLVKEMRQEGNVLLFDNGEKILRVDFGDEVTMAGVETFEDKHVVHVDITRAELKVNEDGSRTSTQEWQILFTDTTSMFFRVERTYPEFVSATNTIRVTEV